MKRYYILSFFLMCLMILPAVAQTPRSGGVLIFGQSGDAVGLDPARETDGESFNVTNAVFETLVEFAPGTTKVQPALAESWEISDDQLQYTFQLRRNVKFHDGTNLNADAVVFSFERQFIKTHPQNQYGPWQYWGYMDMSSIVESVKAVDAYTVRFQLKRKEAPFIANLAMDFASIVSPTAVRKYGAKFSQNPVGTGPFVFVSWKKDDSIIFTKNKNYWREAAYVTRLIFKPIPDQTARFLALQKGEVDIIDFPSPEDFAAMEADKDLKLIQQEGLNVGYLAMNTDRKPFQNKQVRQAINHAINKDEIITAIFGNTGVPATNPIPPSMWSYNKNLKGYDYDPDKARSLLQKAGYPNGFSTTVWAMPVSRPYNPNARRMAEIIQSQLAEVGVKVEIVSYDWGTYLDKTAAGEHDTAMLGWTGDNGDPDNFLNILLSTQATEKPAGNIAFWKNEKFSDLITQAKETSDVAQRTELYREAQEIFEDEAPWVPIAHSLVTVAANKKVMDFVLYPTGKRIFHRVWLER